MVLEFLIKFYIYSLRHCQCQLEKFTLQAMQLGTHD